MKKVAQSVWGTDITQQLAEVIATISDIPTMQSFLRDIMTEKEIIEISSRLQAAKMLWQGDTYTEISRTTKLSSRTIARISDWMQNGCDGYSAALKVISNIHHDHIPPARAE